jgi:hypothetical protein
MVQSLNTKVELTAQATSFSGMNDYGKIMIGDRAFEFYHDRDVTKNIQIPWEQIDYVVASFLFKGKWVPRFTVETKQAGRYTFSARDPKAVLRAVRNHIPADHIVQSLSMAQVLGRSFKAIGEKIKNRKK